LSAAFLWGCANHSGSPAGTGAGPARQATTTARSIAARAASPPQRPRPLTVTVRAPGESTPQWTPVAFVDGQPGAWVAQRTGVTLMRFDQTHTQLRLHAGTVEPEGGRWPYGSRIGDAEQRKAVAAFNGGFKLSYGTVGFVAGGRAAVPLTAGLGSIVTYADGGSEIGAWLEGVPARGRRVTSVLQDLNLLIDRGVPARTVESCPATCWGATLGGGVAVARSALGITGEGQLLWAAGEGLSPSALARAMAAAGVQRAVELDINPEWVAGYLYIHRATGLLPVALVPGQAGIPGQLLAPYSRDFFTVVAR
jgi:hypothetical protein